MTKNAIVTSIESRREFLVHAAVGASFIAIDDAAAKAGELIAEDPYAGVRWDRVQHIGSVSHAHSREQVSLDNLYRRGLRHLGISNYYPSAPVRADERKNEYRVEQKFPADVNGIRTNGPFRWNEIIMNPDSGWFSELPAEQQAAMPFQVGEPIFSHIPRDVILCPNAEHHGMTNLGAHVNGLGSNFASGNFDARGRFQLPANGYPVGVRLPWQEAFEKILAELQFSDGGGITLNHPDWSKLSVDALIECLDFDPRVLGIEIWNHTCEQINGLGWSLETWDAILTTGRRCFGFAVPDHRHRSDADFLGYNVLLIDRETATADLPRESLRAYRTGRFYCTLAGRLSFQRIETKQGRLEISVNRPCRISFHTALGKVSEETGRSASWSLPQSRNERSRTRYVRVEANEIGGKDACFSQPILLTEATL